MIHSPLFGAARVLLAALLAAACSESADDTTAPGAAEGPFGVGLRLTVSEVPTSRTTPSGDYDDGRSAAYENYINVPDGDFRVMLFEASEPYRFMGELDEVRVTAVEADVVRSKTYVLTGSLARPADGTFKLMILANWQGSEARYPAAEPGVTTIDDIAAASLYSYPSDFRLGPGRGIPMYGIKDCTDVSFRPGIAADLGTVHMLRAMAKVEVRMAEGSLPLEKIVLTRAQDCGLAAPRGVYSREDYVKESHSADYLDGIHLSSQAGIIGEIPFRQLSAERYFLYVPEYDNTSAGAVKSRIRLNFERADGQDYFVDFKYYDLHTAREAGAGIGDPFDLRRNCHYIYTVHKRTDTDITVIVDILPYIGVPLEPQFGLTIDEYGNKRDADNNIVVTGKDGLVIVRIAPDGTITDRDGKTVVLDGDNYYARKDAAGKTVWSIRKVSDTRYNVRDGADNLLCSVYLKTE